VCYYRKQQKLTQAFGYPEKAGVSLARTSDKVKHK
jgi:hypothetical protein